MAKVGISLCLASGVSLWSRSLASLWSALGYSVIVQSGFNIRNRNILLIGIVYGWGQDELE